MDHDAGDIGQPDIPDEPDELTEAADGSGFLFEEPDDETEYGKLSTAIVESDNGGHIAFTDADGDGDADVMIEIDEHGTVIGAARYDEATGDWLPVDPSEVASTTFPTAGTPGGTLAETTAAGVESGYSADEWQDSDSEGAGT
jgi:uncharacterized protein YuzE